MTQRKKLLTTCVFYSVFWTILGAFFAVVLTIFLNALDDSRPRWILEDSLIGSNPGLSFRPTGILGLPIILYNSTQEGGSQYYQNELESFLQIYYDGFNQSETVQKCTSEDGPNEGKVCEFKINDNWAPCTGNFGYGYGSPDGGFCIFLKLNKIYGWVPEVYNVNNLPNLMPEDLKTYIRDNEAKHTNQFAYVDCKGQNPADEANIGPINYLPNRGFHKKYFPYTNIPGYLSPLVAVYFENPQKGVVIKVVCRVWAQNIYQDYYKGHGVFQFLVLIN